MFHSIVMYTVIQITMTRHLSVTIETRRTIRWNLLWGAVSLKMVLPKEHGTWMMFFLPYALGAVFSGPTLVHIPFLIGWFFLYLSATPWLSQLRNAKLRKQMRPWALTYTAIGLLFCVPVMLFYVELLWLGFIIMLLFCVNIVFVLRKQERHLLNDLCGIAIFSFGAPAAFVIGTGDLTLDAMLLWAVVTFYFSGTAFYVKSLIRERKNTSFHKTSHIYHGLMLLVPWLFGLGTLVLAFVPGTLKDWFTPRDKNIRPLTVGIIETCNAVVFFLLILWVSPF